MAKLIGTNPNQVPTNADLGTMAYQDSTNTVLENAYINAKGADGLEMGEDYTSPNNSSRLFFNSNTATGNWAIFNNSGSLKFQSGAAAGSTSGNYTSLALSTSGMVLSGTVQTPNRPVFRVGKSSTINGIQDVVFDTVYHNVGSNYSTSTGRFTAPVAAYYYFVWQGISGSATTTNEQNVNIKKNGSNLADSRFLGYQESGGQVITVTYMNANDYVNVTIGNPNTSLYGSAFHNQFMGYLLG